MQDPITAVLGSQGLPKRTYDASGMLKEFFQTEVGMGCLKDVLEGITTPLRVPVNNTFCESHLRPKNLPRRNPWGIYGMHQGKPWEIVGAFCLCSGCTWVSLAFHHDIPGTFLEHLRVFWVGQCGASIFQVVPCD